MVRVGVIGLGKMGLPIARNLMDRGFEVIGYRRQVSPELVEAGGKLPVIIVFVDTDEHVSRVLPTLKEMAANRLIVRENVVLEQGNLE